MLAGDGYESSAYSSDDEQGAALSKQEYDVTPCCLRLCCGQQTLVLEPEEAELTSTTICSSAKKRLPYGQLGNVDHEVCCCCHGFNSALSGADDKGQSQAISPGCGCSVDLVEEIVDALRARMKARGDTANIIRAEQALKLMAHVSAKMDAVVRAWGLVLPPASQMERETIFEEREYDVTSCCHKTCCCGKQVLYMDPEEVRMETTMPCCSSSSIRPYGQLGEVLEAKACGCLSSVGSNLGQMSPGLGCEHDLVAEVVDELKLRMRARGNTGNILRQEEINGLVMAHDARLKEICQRAGAQVPVSQPPAAQVMG